MHNDLFQYLRTEATFEAMFGDRIYHMSLPQSVKTFPAMSFQQITQSEVAGDFEAPNDDKIDMVTYQFDIAATNSKDAIATSKTFDTIFRNFRGTMGATKVQDIQMSNITHFEEREGDKLRRRVSMDYQITFDA